LFHYIKAASKLASQERNSQENFWQEGEEIEGGKSFVLLQGATLVSVVSGFSCFGYLSRLRFASVALSDNLKQSSRYIVIFIAVCTWIELP
jgi:hypothetical protein